MAQGVLPVEYIGASDKYRANALFANAKQMLAQYQQKRLEKVEDSLPILYKPYPRLSQDKELEFIANIRSLIKSEKYKDAVSIYLLFLSALK